MNSNIGKILSMDVQTDLANRDVLIWLVSLFLATCISYWFSDYLIDYGWIYQKDYFDIIFVSLLWFVLIPLTVLLLDKYIKKFVDSLGKGGILIFILLFSFVVCYTLAKLLAWKIS